MKKNNCQKNKKYNNPTPIMFKMIWCNITFVCCELCNGIYQFKMFIKYKKELWGGGGGFCHCTANNISSISKVAVYLTID